jgi:FKBP-type peptidyl-prolyl cis-trans isomerase
MTPFTEDDRKAVATIQSKTGGTLDDARRIYRAEALKLANADVEDRHTLILGNLERIGWEKIEKPEPAPKKTMNERRLERKRKQEEKKQKKAKAKAPKKAKGEKKPSRRVQEEPLPLTELTREVEVREVADSPFVQVKFKGAWTTGYILERDQNAAARFGPVHIADTKFSALKKVAKQNEQEAVVCIVRKINGKVEQGYVIPTSAFKYLGDANPYHRLEFTNEARKSHAEVGWDDCRFNVTKLEKAEKAA